MKLNSSWVELDAVRLCLTRFSTVEPPRHFSLRGRQFRLVNYMAHRNSECGGLPVVCRHEELIAAVWGQDLLADPPSELNRLIHDLRRKIEMHPDSPQLIVNPEFSPILGKRPSDLA